MKSGNLNFLEPSGPLQAYNGTALPLTNVIKQWSLGHWSRIFTIFRTKLPLLTFLVLTTNVLFMLPLPHVICLYLFSVHFHCGLLLDVFSLTFLCWLFNWLCGCFCQHMNNEELDYYYHTFIRKIDHFCVVLKSKRHRNHLHSCLQ